MKEKKFDHGWDDQKKTFLPPIIFSSKSNSKYLSRFLYKGNSQIFLISYKSKNAKDVLILSSFHRDKNIADEEEKNPISYIIGFNSLDQLIGTYICKRKVNR